MSRRVDLIYHKMLLCITIIVSFLVLPDILPSSFPGIASSGPLWDDFLGDPLDPKLLGDSMDMPLDQELIQMARKAGIITESNPLYKPDSEQPGFSIMPRSEEDADNSLDNVNVTGNWSFDLKGKVPAQMNLYLIKNKDLVIGQGLINRENGTQNATASGSISGAKMSLTVMPVGGLSMYKLQLSLSSLTAGTYTAYMGNDSSWSGEVTFTVSSNIFKSHLPVPEYW
jgi:hypothetical protein